MKLQTSYCTRFLLVVLYYYSEKKKKRKEHVDEENYLSSLIYFLYIIIIINKALFKVGLSKHRSELGSDSLSQLVKKILIR